MNDTGYQTPPSSPILGNKRKAPDTNADTKDIIKAKKKIVKIKEDIKDIMKTGSNTVYEGYEVGRLLDLKETLKKKYDMSDSEDNSSTHSSEFEVNSEISDIPKGGKSRRRRRRVRRRKTNKKKTRKAKKKTNKKKRKGNKKRKTRTRRRRKH